MTYSLEMRKSPKVAFKLQRNNARNRGITFSLTFDQWWSIWKKSKRWKQRGHKGHQFVMARFGDIGPYAMDNVRIISVANNNREMWNRRVS